MLPLYIHLFHFQGLFRGFELEVSRDADTGGQAQHVLELAVALSRRPDVERVEVVTRRIEDSRVDPSYGRPSEIINPKAGILRLRCGGRRYLRKELLWPYLDEMADNAIRHLRSQERFPDVIHAHGADAGYVATQVARLFGVPLIFTGHALARPERAHWLGAGLQEADTDRRHLISRRISAEEMTLRHADLVIARSRFEADEHYAMYRAQPARMVVLPQGIAGEDLHLVAPEFQDKVADAFSAQLDRFRLDRAKPMLLAVCPPDRRREIATVVAAYGRRPALREAANLVICSGIRDDARPLPAGERELLAELLLLMDRFDLYGRLAIARASDGLAQLPALVRMAARSRGAFINPGLKTPIGATLIEAAAGGLPVVAARDGETKEILEHCRHGMLVDPSDEEAIGEAMAAVVGDAEAWQEMSSRGLAGVQQHYTWQAHTQRYLEEARAMAGRPRPAMIMSMGEGAVGERLQKLNRVLITDIDDSLLGDPEALQQLLALLQRKRGELAFGVATGHTVESARQILRAHGAPTPDVLISSLGAEIHMGDSREADAGWSSSISYQWVPTEITQALRGLPGLQRQFLEKQRPFRLNYVVDPLTFDPAALKARLAGMKSRCHAVVSREGLSLDILPVRASKARAIRYAASKWDIPLASVVVAGGGANDEEMLVGGTLAVAVGNYSPDLQRLRARLRRKLYFSARKHAAGIIDGLRFFGFLDEGDVAALELARGKSAEAS